MDDKHTANSGPSKPLTDGYHGPAGTGEQHPDHEMLADNHHLEHTERVPHHHMPQREMQREVAAKEGHAMHDGEAFHHQEGFKTRDDMRAMMSEGENKNSEGHPGFKAVQSKIEGEGYTKEQAGAILASKTRAASTAAKKANPHLKRVKG